jgi:endonuclease YncB( thermonuclease family)
MLAASAAASAQEARRCAWLEPGPQRTVVRIIDGETVALDDGRELRLIGALAPRALDAGAEPGTWPLEAAASAALGALVLGKSISLGFVDERVDRYGRLQAHAYLVDGLRERWVQGHLIGQGLARADEQAGNRGCAPELLALEHNARGGRAGLWAQAAYAVREAGRPAELLRYRGRFQIVEGRVARVAQVRGLIYLNFGSFRRRAFFASLRDGDRALLGEHARNPQGLKGRLVRVRGWIERRRDRPAIDLSAAGLIEVLDTGPGGQAQDR